MWQVVKGMCCALTLTLASELQTSLSECGNPCEMSGSEEMRCHANAHCLLVPETSDFKCECKPGYNGTGKICTGTLLPQATN